MVTPREAANTPARRAQTFHELSDGRHHEARAVVVSNGNMGCVHEVGEDFPVGSDCPFCPFWRGRQGSGSKPQTISGVAMALDEFFGEGESRRRPTECRLADLGWHRGTDWALINYLRFEQSPRRAKMEFTDEKPFHSL